MPNDMIWDENRGLFHTQKNNVICNAIPIVDRCKRIHNKKRNISYKTVVIHYKYCKNGIPEEMQEFTMDEVLQGSFMKQQPDSVIIEPMYARKISDIFRNIIQKQAMDIVPEIISQYEYGWNEQLFFTDSWNGLCTDDSDKYSVALELASILKDGDDAVIALVLGMLHGFLVRPLCECGVDHNFVTILKGSSGVGKTELARRLCCCLKDKVQMISLTSSRKELRKHLQVAYDMPIVVDDYARTSSARMAASQMQVLSEIVQTSCNAGKVLLEETSASDNSGFIHVIVTAEQLINNISTINRCYLVEMDEKIPDRTWKKICDFANSDRMLVFLKGILEYISDDYEEFFSRVYSDYSYFQSEIEKKGEDAGNSTNRINQTWVVQQTLAKIIIDYLLTLNLDKKLIGLLNNNIHYSIDNCIGELKATINKLQNKVKHMQYLPTLARMIIEMDGNNDLRVAKDEDKYFNLKIGKKYLGVVLHSGFISFSAKKICSLLEHELDTKVTPKAFSSELKYYSLAYVDKEGKMSSRWNSMHRLYHVNVRQLLQLIYPEDDELFIHNVMCMFELE